MRPGSLGSYIVEVMDREFQALKWERGQLAVLVVVLINATRLRFKPSSGNAAS